MINVKALDFGAAAAERDFARDKNKFKETYLDNWGVESKILKNEFFLVLGPKGSGKTAVGKYCQLVLEEKFGQAKVLTLDAQADTFAPNTSSLSNLTSKLVSEGTQGTTKTAWILFIALRLASLAIADQSSPLNRNGDFQKFWKELKLAGLAVDHEASLEFPDVLRKVRQGSASFNIKLLQGGSSQQGTDEISIGQLGNALINALINNPSDAYYLMTIDGLDRIIGESDSYRLSMSSLFSAVDELHLKFLSAGANIRILVMCRTDVFRKISFADADKAGADSAIHVDWANHQTKIRDSFLWDYLAKKSGISPNDLLSLFPEYVIVGNNQKKIDGIEYCFTSTRATPREMTMLMGRVQEVTPHKAAITGDRLRAAVDLFAQRDLLNIVKAEADVFFDGNSWDALQRVFSSLPSARRVESSVLIAAGQDCGFTADESLNLAKFLFLSGLLGNVNSQKGYVQFYSRRDSYAFRPKGPWVLHRGLMLAFNLPW